MTGKQQAFANNLIKNPTEPIYKAVEGVYNVNNVATAMQIASENIRKPEIMAYLNKHAEQAENTLYEVMSYSKEQGRDSAAYASVAVTAAKDILDRVHGKATQRIEQSSTSVKINISLRRKNDN